MFSQSYLADGNNPAPAPDITGARPQFGCAAGCFEHIVDDPPKKGKHLEIYLVDANGRDMSNRVKWDTDGPDGTCNTEEIKFSAVQ